uniref:Uncharacterized protein LOC105034833 isoform X4 n=1 Tax=Elaeis guineensis var. tenera TaxID=51953 RepID=A0A8N4IDE1_ELAGV|nr:uncharacterized protein LOC105034833 isoform X4 [Elaeis guineensis]
METRDGIWRPDSTSSPSTLARMMNTLLCSRPGHLEAALSRIGSSPPSRSGSAGLLDDSLCSLRRHVKEAVDKEELLDQILVPMIEHLLMSKGSKHCKQVLKLMKWLFQDKLLCEGLASSIAALIMTKEDCFIRFGWCTLVNGLVEFTMNRFPEEGKHEMSIVLGKILYQSFSPLLSIICEGSIVQGEFELPTRLSIVAADCTLLLIETLTETAILKRKSLDSMSENQVDMLTSKFQKECDLGQRISQGLEDIEMEQWLWDHFNEIILLVKKLQAWSGKSQPLHAKGLALVLKWLQEIKQHVHNLQVEPGGNMLKSGILLCFCWKHYACLMRLEDNKFSQKLKGMLEEYVSAIQILDLKSRSRERLVRTKYYTQNENDNDAGKSYGSIETRKFFLNCLCLLLGHLDGKQLEVVITEHGPQLLNLLFSQLRYGDEFLMEGSLSILRVLIFKENFSSGSSNLNTAEMDMVLPLLLSFLDVRDSIAKAVVLLFAEYCSLNSDRKGLQEIFRRLEFGDLSQKKNAVDVISELIRICSDLELRQDIAKHLLKCLGDEDLMNYVEESNLLPQFDPHFVLPALVQLRFSGNEKVQSTASNTIAAVLKCHSRESSVILALLDCLSVLGGNPNAAQTTGAMTKDVHCTSMQSHSGEMLDIDQVLGLIPKLPESVENWKFLLDKVIDKMFQDPSNAIIVRFMSRISEDLVEAGDLVLHRVLLHLQEQKKMDERWLSDCHGNFPSNGSAKLGGSVFDHLSPLLLLRVLPLRVFDDIYSPVLYGRLCKNLEASGICINGDDCVTSLLVNRAFSMFEFEDVRKLAAELCGRLHPEVLFPIMESQLRHATQGRDILKMKLCLFAICTSLVARDSDSAFHPAIHRIRKILEMVLLWPSFDADEVSQVQHGCIDCLALMICVEVKALETSKDFSRNWLSISRDASCPGCHTSTSSVLTYVIQRLTNNELYDVSVKNNMSTCHEESFVIDMSHGTSLATIDLSTISTSIPFRLCMANVLISACLKVSNSGKSLFACKVLPSVIYAVESIACSDVRAGCIEVLFSAVYHLKSSVVPFSSDLFNLSVKALKKGSNKEKLAAAKLMASLMASEDEIIAAISGGLLEAKSVLEKAATKASFSELQQLCKKLLACLSSVN